VKDHVRADWRQVVLVCGKCSRKLHGGFGPGGDKPLAKALRRQAGGGKGRKATLGVVEVGCLKICPKGAVVVVDAARPREWLLVAAGTPVGEVAVRLGMAAEPSPPAVRSPADAGA
jgi:predicted metal-binding protein